MVHNEHEDRCLRLYLRASAISSQRPFSTTFLDEKRFRSLRSTVHKLRSNGWSRSIPFRLRRFSLVIKKYNTLYLPTSKSRTSSPTSTCPLVDQQLGCPWDFDDFSSCLHNALISPKCRVPALWDIAPCVLSNVQSGLTLGI
jgi:hypothetical protein